MTPEEILQVEKDIVATLKNIYDPEIPVNIYDLGLIYEIDYEPDGVANIRMTLTAPNCPMADMLVEDVNQQVAKVKGVKSVNVILTFDPVWDKSMMSCSFFICARSAVCVLFSPFKAAARLSAVLVAWATAGASVAALSASSAGVSLATMARNLVSAACR